MQTKYWLIQEESFLLYINVYIQKHTHSMPSINGVSAQSFSGKRCKIFPVRFPLPYKEKQIIFENKSFIENIHV